MADEDLRQAFRDLATKVNETKQRIAQGEMAKRMSLKNEKTCRLAATQLKEFGSDKVTYRGVGRVFLLSSHGDEIKRHVEEAEQHKEKAAAFDRQKELLQKSVEESERNLREMVEQRR